MARRTGDISTRTAPSLALVFLLATISQAVAGGELTGFPEVIEGDVITLEGHRIRLAGIDAPEPGQRCLFREKLYDCGEISRSALQDLTAGTEVACKTVGEGPGDTVVALTCLYVMDMIVRGEWRRVAQVSSVATLTRLRCPIPAMRMALSTDEWAWSDV